ncbi:hypothetical protein K501DRAFT_269595 [Backusella circina FSU 941]|nr:hypothetical protein K501DRAFT_269595 [Backusella circina FSU 941]
MFRDLYRSKHVDREVTDVDYLMYGIYSYAECSSSSRCLNFLRQKSKVSVDEGLFSLDFVFIAGHHGYVVTYLGFVVVHHGHVFTYFVFSFTTFLLRSLRFLQNVRALVYYPNNVTVSVNQKGTFLSSWCS